MQRQIRHQRDAEPQWAYLVSQRPGCENLFACMQCGACSGGCPLSIYMDLTPRRIIAMVREGFRTDALKSQTIWLCASCYACVVRCPQKIEITDVMYSLKREAIRHHLYPSRFPIPALARAFYEGVRSHGRSSEFWVVLGMALRSNPLKLLSMLRTGWQLIRTGRMSFRHERIKGVGELQRALAVYQKGA